MLFSEFLPNLARTESAKKQIILLTFYLPGFNEQLPNTVTQLIYCSNSSNSRVIFGNITWMFGRCENQRLITSERR